MRFIITLLLTTLLAGCSASHRWNANTELITNPTPDKALVSFVRARERRAMQLWDGDRFLGLLPGRTIMQVEVDPGEHLFMTWTGRRQGWLEADLQGGKHYVIVAKHVRTGEPQLNPASNVSDARIKGWFKSYSTIVLDEEKRLEHEALYQKKVRGYIEGYHEDMEEGIQAAVIDLVTE